MSDKTSIQISAETKDRLVRLGIKGETYDDIINRLLDHAAKKRRNNSKLDDPCQD